MIDMDSYRRDIRSHPLIPRLSFIEQPQDPNATYPTVDQALGGFNRVVDCLVVVFGILIVAAAVGGAMGGFSGLGSA